MPPVHVWRVRLDVDLAAIEACGAVLDVDERRRAGRFARDEDRRTFVVARAALRHLLGDALGVAPDRVAFVYGPAGKPSLAGATGLHFNVAHAGDEALIATSRAGPVGIDIERDVDVPEREALAADFFPPLAKAALADSPDALRPRVFLQLWACNEALSKAAGTGLLAGSALDLRKQDWEVVPIVAPQGYVAALAKPWGCRVIFDDLGGW